MPLAKSPERALEERREGVNEYDLSPLQLIQIRQTVGTILWDTNKKLLDLVEVAVTAGSNADAWIVVRKLMLDRFADEEKAIRVAVNTIMSVSQDDFVQA